MKLVIQQQPNLSTPTLIAGWPGMGNVAILAVDYLRRKVGAQKLGFVDVVEDIFPEAVLVDNGIITLPQLPRYNLYYKNDLDLLIFEGEAQLRGKEGVDLINCILTIAKKLRVSKVITGAAFPMPISWNTPSTVYGCATNSFLRRYLVETHGVRMMDRGEISGLNGLLLGYAGAKGIPALCLLATMPLYAINLPNPKASKAIIEVIGRLLEIKIDTEELDIKAKEMEEEMMKLEEKIKKGILPWKEEEEKRKEEEEVPKEEKDEQGIPLYVRRKIERLFKEAKHNKAKAYILKKELDKWNLFEAYEDRFLDLFKEH